jgi:ATP-dependent Clp protease ATP-binding subunit ClpB
MLDLLERAEREAGRERAPAVGLEHLLNALTQEIRGPAGEVLGAFGIAPGSLRAHVGALRSVARAAVAREASRGPETAGLRSLLDEARSGRWDPVIARTAELRRLVTILERRQKSHPLLIGEPGVGKGAVIRALARRIAGGDVPTSLASAKLYELDAGALIAGARLRGEIEERLRRLIAGISSKGEPAILVSRSVDQLFGQGSAGSGVGELLRPALGRDEFRLLATTTPEGLRRMQDRDPELLRLFTLLPIEEPNLEGATEIVRGVAARYERHHHVVISERALVAAVQLAKRYVSDRRLPDSAIDLLDEAAAAKRVEIDGMPNAADAVLRRLESLEAQLASLADDPGAGDVRARLEAELNELEPKAKQIRAELDARRGVVAAVRALRAELFEAERLADQAKSTDDRLRAGELERSRAELAARLAEAEQAAQSGGAPSRVLGEQDVAATLAVWTGIPVQKMLEAEADKLLKMEQRLSERVVGQEQALYAVARSVRRSRVGLRDPGKPIGSFLFLGPSGVGKTELAKALAQFLFDDEAALTRLDMSEFMERHMAQRLIGAPPGYADSEQGGFLTEAVRRRPYSVLLFDEVEKAHHDVFNLLLQVLDDGRLTDGRGRQADFSNTVVIMTSNIGSERILETEPALFESDEGRGALRDVLLERLREFFRPEFLNRVDEVLVFRPLTRDHLQKVAEIELQKLARLLGERGLALDVDEAAKRRLVELGYDPALGARPLKRAIVRELQDPLAQMLLAQGLGEGATIRVRAAETGFVFESHA